MRFKNFSFVAVFLLSLVVFMGCNNSPAGPSSEEDQVFSGDPLIVEVEKESVNGKIGISFYLTSQAFDSANTKTKISGFPGDLQGGTYIKKDNRLFFWVKASPGVYVFDFSGDKDSMKEEIVESDSLYVPEVGKFALKITKDYKVVRATLSEVLHLGKDVEVADSSDSVVVIGENSDGKVIIKIVSENDTIRDTVTVSKTKGTIVFLGDSVIFKKAPNPSSLGYDTVRIGKPEAPKVVNYNGIIKHISTEKVNVGGVQKYKVKATTDSILIKKITGKEFKPFAIGLPSWETPINLGTKSGDRYPFTSDPLLPGLIKFGVGGSYKDGIWADSSILSKSSWGLKTKDGWIIAGWLFADGRFVAWSLVDTTTATVKVKDSIVVVKDTIKTVDTVVVHDTLTVKGEKIIIRDTVVITEKNHDTTIVIDTVHHRDTIMVKDTVFSSDTIVLKDTTVIKDTTVVYDTIVKNGETIRIRDTVIITHTKIDTLLKIDTLHSVDTVKVVDKGNRDVFVAGIKFDTLWIDSANHLKGVAKKDSTYRTLHIHEVLTIVKGDTVINSDTSFATKFVSISSDTFDLVFLFVSATPATADTFNVKFKVTSKVFDDSVANILGLKEDWNEKIKSSSKSNGFFNFTNIKMVKGKKYRTNFVSSGTAWAEQSVLLFSQFAYQERSSTDLAVSLNSTATNFIYAPPAAQ